MTRAMLLAALLGVTAWAQQTDPRDLRGIWQAKGTAYRDLESAKGVIVDPANGKIPYRSDARAAVARNLRERTTADTLLSCFQPGIPRAALLPEPFRSFKLKTASRSSTSMSMRIASSSRTVVLTTTMASSFTWATRADIGRATRLLWMSQTSSPKLGSTVREHSTATSYMWWSATPEPQPNTLRYEARIEDPEVFERPWTIRLDLARRTEPNFQLLEHGV